MDFDGAITIKDLKQFLNEVLGYSNDKLIDSKIERLFKVLDVTKTGKIFQTDLEEAFKLNDSIRRAVSSSSATRILRRFMNRDRP